MKSYSKLLAIALFTLTSFAYTQTTSAASCSTGDATTNLSGGGSVFANACINHAGNDGGGVAFSLEINSLFGTTGTWSQADKDDSGGLLSSGNWDFSSISISNPFVIVLKAGKNFSAYLFSVFTDGTGTYNTVGIDPGSMKSRDLSHISIYTTEGGGVGEVPVPAAIWLFGSALLGFVGIRRKYTA